MPLRRQSSLVVVLGVFVFVACGRTPLETPLGPAASTNLAIDLVPTATSVLAKRDTTPTLRTTVTLVNRAESPTYLEYGACATRVLAYRTTASGASPVWDSNKRRLWDSGQPLVCLLYLAATTVAPGATLAAPEFSLEVPLIDVLGDSLPDGHYYFKASIGFSNRAAITDLPAGDAELTLARPPLATTRRSFIMQWNALSVTLSDGTVHARATGTVVNANSAQITLEKNCPILIRVYRDRARRDAAPRSGAADWSQPGCTSLTETKVLVRGETTTFDTSVPVDDILKKALSPGKYYFAVLVKGDGMAMTLSAGELDLVR